MYLPIRFGQVSNALMVLSVRRRLRGDVDVAEPAVGASASPQGTGNVLQTHDVFWVNKIQDFCTVGKPSISYFCQCKNHQNPIYILVNL